MVRVRKKLGDYKKTTIAIYTDDIQRLAKRGASKSESMADIVKRMLDQIERYEKVATVQPSPHTTG